MSFYRRSVRAPHKLINTHCLRNLASIAAPNIECQHAGHSLAVFGIAEFTVEPIAFRELLLFTSDGRRLEGFVSLFAS